MRKFVRIARFAAVVFVTWTQLVSAVPSKREEAVQLFERAARLSLLRAQATGPFVLRAAVFVRVRDDSYAQGEYVLVWVSPEQWREEVKFPGYTRLRGVHKGQQWLWRSMDHEHVRVYQLDGILFPSSKAVLPANSPVRSVKSRERDGRVLTCVETETSESCFDPNNGTLVSQRDLEQPASVEYRDYFNFRNVHFPRQMERFRGAKAVVTVEVSELRELTAADDSVDFHPPTTPGVRIWCKDVRPAEPTKQVHTNLAGLPPVVSGEVVVYAFVGTDGRPRNVQVIGSTDEKLGEAARKAIEQWRFRPATCDGNPVEVEEIIYTSYGSTVLTTP